MSTPPKRQGSSPPSPSAPKRSRLSTSADVASPSSDFTSTSPDVASILSEIQSIFKHRRASIESDFQTWLSKGTASLCIPPHPPLFPPTAIPRLTHHRRSRTSFIPNTTIIGPISVVFLHKQHVRKTGIDLSLGRMARLRIKRR
jgi:hypothetical protein